MKPLHLLLFFILFSSNFIFAQKNTFTGQFYSKDSISLNDIHIKNIRTGHISISNNLGEFVLEAKPKDTLLFQAIYINRNYIILTQEDIDQAYQKIELFGRTNELSEVELKLHHLKGSLSADIGKTPIDNTPKMNSLASDYSNIDWNTPLKDDEMSRKKIIPNRQKGQMKGLDVLSVALLAVTETVDLLTNDKKKALRQKERLKKQEYSELRTNFRTILKDHYGNHFFENTLAIQKEKYDDFVGFCLDDTENDMVQYYQDKNYFKLISLLKENAIAYNNIK